MRLFEIVETFAHYNGVNIRPFNEWPNIKNLPALIRQADKLPKDDDFIVVLVDGEESEISNIVNEWDILELDNFLNDVFNNEISIFII